MIREYRAGDFEACVGIVSRVWDFDGRFQPQALADLFKSFYDRLVFP